MLLNNNHIGEKSGKIASARSSYPGRFFANSVKRVHTGVILTKLRSDSTLLALTDELRRISPTSDTYYCDGFFRHERQFNLSPPRLYGLSSYAKSLYQPFPNVRIPRVRLTASTQQIRESGLREVDGTRGTKLRSRMLKTSRSILGGICAESRMIWST
jgi:hypothetical protein